MKGRVAMNDLAARFAIRDQLGRFARILDGKSWYAVGEVFADDVAFDYGDGGEKHGIAALVAQFRRYLDVCGATQHLLGSIIVECGDAPVSRAYVQARHQGIGAKADRFLDTNGEYVDRWRCDGGVWRIVRRDATWAVHQGDFGVLLAD